MATWKAILANSQTQLPPKLINGDHQVPDNHTTHTHRAAQGASVPKKILQNQTSAPPIQHIYVGKVNNIQDTAPPQGKTRFLKPPVATFEWQTVTSTRRTLNKRQRCSRPAMDFVCFNCLKKGHTKRNCKNRTHCFNCLKEGHIKRNCRNQIHCFLCGQPGHNKAQCRVQALSKESRQIIPVPHSQNKLPTMEFHHEKPNHSPPFNLSTRSPRQWNRVVMRHTTDWVAKRHEKYRWIPKKAPATSALTMKWIPKKQATPRTTPAPAAIIPHQQSQNPHPITINQDPLSPQPDPLANHLTVLTPYQLAVTIKNKPQFKITVTYLQPKPKLYSSLQLVMIDGTLFPDKPLPLHTFMFTMHTNEVHNPAEPFGPKVQLQLLNQNQTSDLIQSELGLQAQAQQDINTQPPLVSILNNQAQNRNEPLLLQGLESMTNEPVFSPRRSARLQTKNRPDFNTLSGRLNRQARNITARRNSSLPFPLQEQVTPLVADQTLQLFHASGVELDAGVVAKVDKAFADSPDVPPKTPLHDTVPLAPFEQMTGME